MVIRCGRVEEAEGMLSWHLEYKRAMIRHCELVLPEEQDICVDTKIHVAVQGCVLISVTTRVKKCLCKVPSLE